MTVLFGTILVFASFQIFHYKSLPYPTTVGKFKDRISWVGNVAKGDASIALQSPVVSDNGTFICSVRNPPDVYHNIPKTVLIVTERGKLHSIACPHLWDTAALQLCWDLASLSITCEMGSLELHLRIPARVTSALLSELNTLRTVEFIGSRKGQRKLW